MCVPYNIILQSIGRIDLFILSFSLVAIEAIYLCIKLASVAATVACLAEPLVRAEWALIVKHSMFTAFMVSIVLLSPTLPILIFVITISRSFTPFCYLSLLNFY